MNRAERNKLVVENLPLVGYLVSEVWAKARHLSRDDLASAGALALITSADAFNPDLGVPFGAFARRRIIGAFADDMRSSDWATRSARRRIKETVAVQETLAAALGRTATVDEIAAALGVDRETAAAGLADASRTLSTLDDTTAEFLVADTALPEESLLSEERLAYLRAAIAALPENMRLVVQQIYFDDRPVKDIAAELGITHSAVSQQRAEAIRLLRDGLGTHYSDDSDTAYVPESRVAPARRSAYLARLADHAMIGIASLAHDRVPAAIAAISAPGVSSKELSSQNG
ncbi:RNA polymerase sigma factor for flagellar operon FliA [Cryobacterium psychrotolerans]|uniref:RNA polymerase sigma factor for flagellar operon FliA n=1 Tax=Cryobacterium psychrotolerans TaxID=386301 RepID=A0A1G8YB85_9MICO|nr:MULTISPECIES: sigma-70 family RNA polymerase sigma factor [Cryobacterium]TFD49318.1 sigma-70 family RNA polymerase sigma factor [Cryobacterium sp. TMT1-2-1]TFD90914.1 sigma-70 family RNA polymerase sigma factor [Cryobacterium psychrotolerans]SDJ99674.1 RNA polymerase sigma factor for flagellar operon FliA [Cryobacterium psychrotolerans]